MVQTNAADEKQVKKGEKKELTKREQEIDEMRTVLSTRQGRRFVWRHISNAGIFEQSFTGNSATFFNEGRRAIGLKLWAEILASGPESLIQMMKEAQQEEE